MNQSFVFERSKDSIIFKTEGKSKTYKVEVTDGDYEAHYSISGLAKVGFHRDLYDLITKYGKTEFVWYSTDFFDKD